MCHPASTLIFFCVGPGFPGSSHLPEKRHVGKLHKLQTWVWVSKVGWFWLARQKLQSTSSKWPWMIVISNIESSKFSSADQVGVVQVRRSLPWPLVRSFCAAFIWIPLKSPQQNSLSSTNLQGRGPLLVCYPSMLIQNPFSTGCNRARALQHQKDQKPAWQAPS